MRISGRLRSIAAAVALAALAACGGPGPETGEPAAGKTTARGPDQVPPEAEAVLARADAYDGSADHVVGRCAGCALHMEGKPDHALAMAGYELRFCTVECRDTFAKAPVEKLLAMEMPEEGDSDSGA